MHTYKNQSIEYSNPTSVVGKPAASSTMINVTNPADGIAAAPIDAAADVKLQEERFQAVAWRDKMHKATVSYRSTVIIAKKWMNSLFKSML